MTERDPAVRHFALIQLARTGGIVLLFLGLTILFEKVEAPQFLGIALILAGMAGFFALPLILARRWRTPRR